MTNGRPECPLDSVLLPVQDRQGSPVRYQRTVDMAGPVTDIPEFHDCQRLVLADGQTYDSLYAIFASNNLDSLAEAHGRSAQAGARATAYTAATIYSWEGTYAPLHIRPRFNCLYLWRDGARWEAFMVQVGDRDTECRADRVPGDAGAQPLRVRVTMEGAFGAEEYPQVARWDWDPKRREHFIGIACGRAWCEVSSDGAVASPASPAFATARHALRRVHGIKGWHDYQWLAERDPAAPASGPGSHRLRPFAIRAMVVPDTLLPTYVDATFAAPTPVATVYLDADHPEYRHKYNFAPGANAIALLRRPDGVWKARITTEGGVTQWRDVVRRDHTAHMAAHHMHVPGTARWRWKARDETVWVRCAEGCCEVQDTDK
jgi:hypothetical protein